MKYAFFNILEKRQNLKFSSVALFGLICVNYYTLKRSLEDFDALFSYPKNDQ